MIVGAHRISGYLEVTDNLLVMVPVLSVLQYVDRKDNKLKVMVNKSTK